VSQMLVYSTPSPDEVRQIEQICDRFEAAWKGGEQPPLEAYLGQALVPLHRTLVRELLLLDWEYRLRAGDHPQAAEYVARLPTFAPLIETIAREVTASTVDDYPVPQRLGEYRIVRQVGRGGMGVVYEAVHEPLGRRVALKLLPGIDLANPTARERFRREAQMTARLHHANIVQILEVGEYHGQPFLALEFVAGPSLSERLRAAPEPPRQAAALVETLARAVHHAHEQGIVHRDLKPANVLLDRGGPGPHVVEYPAGIEQAPLEQYTPKVADFGLAHPVGEGDLTATGQIVGTPGYMAPEQAWGKSKRLLVGPAVDIYALGAVLYKTLTGRPPFHGATALDALEQVRSHEPVPPTRVQPQVPRDLETICLKCLEKEPGSRYASAEALAEDLRRFQTGEPITARRTHRIERMKRWCRRNPAPVAACVLGVVALAAAGGLAVSHAFTVQLRQEQKLTKSALQDAEFQRVRAQRSAEQLAQQQALTNAALVKAEHFRLQAERISTTMVLERGLALLEQGEVARAMLLLGRSLQIAPTGAADLQRVIRSNLAAAHGQLPFHLTSILEHGGEVQAAVFSPDGKLLLTGGRVSSPRVWDAASGEPVGEALPHSGEIRAVAFSSDGATIATAGTDKTARLWDATSGKPIGKPLEHAHWVQSVAFSADGQTILTGSADGTARLWASATGEPRGELRPAGWVHAVAFSPDGKTIATAGSAQSAQLWDAATLKPIGAPLRHQGEVWAASFSPDGRALVTGSEEGTARLWEADTGKPLGLPLVHQGPVRCVGYSRDGKVLWTAGAYGKVGFWDATTMNPLGAPVQHQSAVYAVALSPDQSRLATGSSDGKVRLWEKSVPRSPGVVLAHDRLVYCVAFSPDGKTVATGSADESVRLWDAATGTRVGNPLTHPSSILRVAFSPDGRTLLTACSDKTARLWDVADYRPRGPVLQHADHVYAVAFSPDGKTILTGCKDATARLWDAATGEPRVKPLQHPRWVHAVAFSPDGTTILTGCEDSIARLWDAASGKPLGEPLQHRGPVRAVAFSPDGRMLLTGTWDDGTARLWDAATRKPLGPPLPHREHVLAVAFSPDGKTVATGAWDGTARLWDVATGKPLGPQLVHQRTVRDVAFSPDGKTLLTGSFDRTVRSWEMPIPVAGNVDQIVLSIQVLTGMELDDDGLFRDLDAPAWLQRRQLLTRLISP
jgi:eukaryotic-like serine/threonine-protein kinase